MSFTASQNVGVVEGEATVEVGAGVLQGVDVAAADSNAVVVGGGEVREAVVDSGAETVEDVGEGDSVRIWERSTSRFWWTRWFKRFLLAVTMSLFV